MSIINGINNYYKEKEKRNWDTGYWFFDIHGTILKPNYQAGNIPDEFYPKALETLQLISKMDDIVMVLYTCSHPHEIVEYLKIFEANDIHFKYVNENPEVKTDLEGYGNYDKKPYMNLLFEDKAGFDAENEWHDVYNHLMDIENPTEISLDYYNNVLKNGDYVLVQGNEVTKIFQKDRKLYFEVYGTISRVNEYFSNDLEISNEEEYNKYIESCQKK